MLDYVSKSTVFLSGMGFVMAYSNEAIARILCERHAELLAKCIQGADGAIAPADRRVRT